MLTYFLTALLSPVMHDDGRVDEGAGSRHILSQQAFHFVGTQADWQIEELHRSIRGIICAGMRETSGLFEPLMQKTAGSRCFLFINARHLNVKQRWINGYELGGKPMAAREQSVSARYIARNHTGLVCCESTARRNEISIKRPSFLLKIKFILRRGDCSFS